MNEKSEDIKVVKALKDKFDILFNKANDSRSAGDIHKAHEYAQIALKISERLDDKSYIIKSLNLIGLCHVSVNQYDKSLEYYHKAIDISNSIDDKVLLSITLNNIAYIYGVLKNTDKALEYYLDALEYDDANFRSLNSAGTIYLSKKMYDLAEPLLKKAYNIAVRDNYKRSQVISLINMANLEQYRRNFSESYSYLEEVKELIYLYPGKELEVYYYLQLGETLQADNKMNEALLNIEKAYDLSLSIEEISIRLICLSVLKKYFEALNDYKMAYMYACEESSLKEVFFNQQLNDKIASLNASYELSQKELKAHQLMEKSSKLFSIGVMAAGITHEINQPLNAISVSANSILYWNQNNDRVLPEMFIEEIEQIAEGADRIDKIIKHMRSFWAHSDENDVESDLNFNETVVTAVNLIERQLYAHGILLINEISNEEYKLKTNKVNIEQIVVNLLNNAMHSLDECDKPDKKIKISTEMQNDSIILKVTDNGTGLSVSDTEKVFDPFFSTKKPGKGMGLGLAIVKNLVLKMHGTIKANNLKDGGACFTVFIPVNMEDN